MKKAIATILAAVIVCSLFAGAVTFADNPTLEEALAAAKPELYGMYTAQSGGYLRDCYDRAQAATEDNGEAAALTAAVGALVPLVNYTRSPLIGFVNVSAETVAAMKYNSGSVSAAEGVVTLTGEGTLRYCNAAKDGIAGDSPFGIATDDCDGFALKIAADADAVLDIEIGRRGSANDCVFTLSDVAVTAGERYYLFPFDRFGDIPVDGTLNYISLSFTGAGEVSFSDLHAVASVETAVNAEYYETKLAAPSFESSKYYKITLFGEPDKVFEMVDDTGNGKYMLAAPVQGKAAQEWQIVKDISNPSRYRIINRHYGTALYANTTGAAPSLDDIVPNQTDTNQEWSVSYNGKKGFTLKISFATPIGGQKATNLSTTIDGRVRCSTTAKTFDIYEIPGDTWNLVWSEEFNDGEVDRTTWRNRTGKFRPVREPIYHRDGPENMYFEDRDDDGVVSGNLVIRTDTSPCEETARYYQTEGHGDDLLATGAYLDTVGNHLFTYGRMEIRAQLPEGDHIWPAGWMMGTSTMGWAACGELDIIEMVGNGERGNYTGDSSPIATIHCMHDSGVGYTQGSNAYGKMLTDDILAHAYHTYAVEWDATSVRWFWDDIMFFCMPIDTNEEQFSFLRNPMYLILNTAIDSSKKEDQGISYLPDNTPEESFYYIDYIRYYKKPSETTPEADSPVPEVDNFAFFSDQSSEIENVMVIDNTGNKAVMTGKSNRITIYDIPTGRRENTYAVNYADCPWSGAVSPDGTKYVVIEQGGNDRVSGTMAGRILVFDSSFGAPTVIEGSYASCAECAITPDSKHLVVFGRAHSNEGRDAAKNVYVFDLETGETVMKDPYVTYGREVAMAADGRFAAAGTDGTAKLYGTDFTCIGTLENDILVSAMSFSGDSKRLATCNTCGVVRVWNAETGELVKAIDGPGEYDILSAAMNADGSRVAVGCSDFCVRLFDVDTGKLIKRMTGAQAFIANVRYSPDYSVIAAASNDGRIRIYDTDGNIRCILKSNRSDTGYIDKFLFSADSKHIAAEIFIQQKSCVAFWELPDGLTVEKADFTALEALPYYDETAYTSESYAAYSAALKAANAVKANPYSAQSAIDEAAQAVSEAAAALVEGGDEPEIMKGDMDKDGEITVADALAALRIAAKLVASSEEAVAIGDTDNDGEITVADALKILRVAAKLVASL
ncbi:MAG: family 16 glycosylhydrolase [Clostridia bacterium]|nr:family 16 glycosylhydrolase [Clostridia bacterium]